MTSIADRVRKLGPTIEQHLQNGRDFPREWRIGGGPTLNTKDYVKELKRLHPSDFGNVKDATLAASINAYLRNTVGPVREITKKDSNETLPTHTHVFMLPKGARALRLTTTDPSPTVEVETVQRVALSDGGNDAGS